MGLPGGSELIIVLVVLLLLFGSSKLPGLARSMGQAKKEFKAGIKDGFGDESPASDCPSCGKKLDGDAKFCASCGNAVPAATPA